MRVGSLFAGVGGFDLAAESAGLEVAWQSEIDPAASRVLKHRWPELVNRGDICGVTDTAGVDVLVGGFPCQDYSVAGNRAGLVGDRGAMWWQFHRLIAEGRPTWVVGENVPGLLSSRGGADFATIVDSLVELGYGVVWGVLDAQYFGVAQRRRRVFIVGHSGGRPRPEVLALGEGLFGDSAPSREPGEVTTAITASSFGRGGADDNNAQGGHLIPFSQNKFDLYEETDIAVTLAARDNRSSTTMVAMAFDELNNSMDDEVHHTLRAGTKQSTGVVAFAQNQRDEVRDLGDVAGSLSAQPGMKQQTYVLQGSMIGRSDDAGPAGAGFSEGPSYTLDVASGPHGVAGVRSSSGSDTVNTLMPTFGAKNYSNHQEIKSGSLLFGQRGFVRRLTPVECERLQGFPDGWTDVPGNSDSGRYQQLGNAVAVPVAEWILRRLS